MLTLDVLSVEKCTKKKKKKKKVLGPQMSQFQLHSNHPDNHTPTTKPTTQTESIQPCCNHKTNYPDNSHVTIYSSHQTNHLDCNHSASLQPQTNCLHSNHTSLQPQNQPQTATMKSMSVLDSNHKINTYTANTRTAATHMHSNHLDSTT